MTKDLKAEALSFSKKVISTQKPELILQVLASFYNPFRGFFALLPGPDPLFLVVFNDPRMKFNKCALSSSL